ncbi:hypothetical protein [Photobacterium minamisatsumaniensis]
MAAKHWNKERLEQGEFVQHESMSMHDGIAIWCDCCVCEAEPYWVEVAEEMGINLSNYDESASDLNK